MNAFSTLFFSVMPKKNPTSLAALVRYYILAATTAAGSGHVTSSLSATDLLTSLFFDGFFRFDPKQPEYQNNDRFILSKGHASPLLYALWTVAGEITEQELLTLRKFDSRLEGHPTPAFPFTEAATGSLGQGLSVGVGMAMNAQYIEHLSYKTFVLLGDSELAEGSVWEAIDFAAYYKLNSLIGILDVNRLGQRGETKLGWNVKYYEDQLRAHGWKPIVINGHDPKQIRKAYKEALEEKDHPVMIIAKTVKGKGVSFLENKNGWHGKALSKEEFDRAVKELGPIDRTKKGFLVFPEEWENKEYLPKKYKTVAYEHAKPFAPRKAYGQALVRIHPQFPHMVVLDAEVGNSTYAGLFAKAYDERFIEMYIAEQNMIGVALGLSRRGKIPFVSTFAAFLTRAFDQIRMSEYSEGNIKFVGSHVGVSIGEDGVSQMGLEDIAMFRTLLNCVVLYPSDAMSMDKLVEAAAGHRGNVYIRTTRADLPVLYKQSDEFVIGGSKVVKESEEDLLTIVTAGITLHEALKAYDVLKKEKIFIRVIDLYSIKPLDVETLKLAAKKTKAIVTVEDHYAAGGIGEAVKSALATVRKPVHSLAVRKMPKSGTSQELLAYEEIDAAAIVALCKTILKKK